MQFTIYTKDGCPFCVKAKDIMVSKGWGYNEIDLSNDVERLNFYAKTRTKSVPQIYMEDTHIGGFTELKKFAEGPRIKQPKEAYVFDYKTPVKMAQTQNKVFWLAEEIEVEKDVQDIMVNLTESERHGVITVLRLFTLYELIAGNEYWGERVKNTFPRPDIQMMANAFSYFEINVHAPFYNKLNEALHLNTDDFYLSYINDPVLKSRMEFIDSIVNDPDDLVSLAVFSMVEGAVLYSSFAFLKHFQACGKNKLVNIVRGIDFSVRDENLHCQGGAWLYRTLKEEMANVDDSHIQRIYDAAHEIFEHESRIVDMIFEKGNIEGITKLQLQNFIKSRINECLVNLGLERQFKVDYNPIKDWFYSSINGYSFHDFFTGISNAYHRKWNEANFTW